MLVEVQNLDNGSGVNDNLDIYLSYNDKRKLFELRPFCRIHENDFCSLLTERQYVQFCEQNAIHFRVNKNELSEKANKLY